jgi:hypothetical protein
MLAHSMSLGIASLRAVNAYVAGIVDGQVKHRKGGGAPSLPRTDSPGVGWMARRDNLQAPSGLSAFAYQVDADPMHGLLLITETNRILLVLFDVHNRTLGPYMWQRSMGSSFQQWLTPSQCSGRSHLSACCYCPRKHETRVPALGASRRNAAHPS